MNLGLGPGLFIPLGGWSRNLKNGSLWSITVQKKLSSRIAVEGNLDYVTLRGKGNEALRLSLFPLSLSGVYRFLPIHENLSLNLLAGFSFYQSHLRLQEGEEWSRDWGLKWGLGLETCLNSNLWIEPFFLDRQIFQKGGGANGFSAELRMKILLAKEKGE